MLKMDDKALESIQNDLPDALALIKEMIQCVSTTLTSVQTLLKRVNSGEIKTSKGISFLEVKYHMLLNYLINLTYVVLRKISGNKLEGEPAIDHLVEIRTVLEKMRPIDQKLNYQVNKLLSATTGNVNPNDPLWLKPNPDALINKLSDDEDTEADSEGEKEQKEEKQKSNIYIPPKVVAMHYGGDETEQDRRQRLLDRARKRALSSSIVQELRREYDEGPEEIRETVDMHKLKEDKKAKDRLRYEEEFMQRLHVPKKQRHNAKQVATMSSLSGLTKFEDISALELGVEDLPLKRKKNPKVPKSKAKKGKRKILRMKRR